MIAKIVYGRDGEATVQFIACDLYVGCPADRNDRLVLVLDGARYDLSDLVPELKRRIAQFDHLNENCPAPPGEGDKP